MLRFRGQIYVPCVDDLRSMILTKAHSFLYTVYPENVKKYQDLRKLFWWSDMKKDVFDFVAKCLECQ